MRTTSHHPELIDQMQSGDQCARIFYSVGTICFSAVLGLIGGMFYNLSKKIDHSQGATDNPTYGDNLGYGAGVGALAGVFMLTLYCMNKAGCFDGIKNFLSSCTSALSNCFKSLPQSKQEQQFEQVSETVTLEIK